MYVLQASRSEQPPYEGNETILLGGKLNWGAPGKALDMFTGKIAGAAIYKEAWISTITTRPILDQSEHRSLTHSSLQA